MSGTIEAQGTLLKIRCQTQQPRGKPVGGTRGAISTFSRASRKRMIEFMARLKSRGVRATFITLTFSGNPTPDEAKNALKRFVMRIRRHYEDTSGLWRMEYQERGAIHFHLLLFRLPFIPQRQLQACWEVCTREETSIVDVRLVRSGKMVSAYISKYMAKVPEQEGMTSLDDDAYQHAPPRDAPGRFWGYINKSALPLGQKFQGDLYGKEVYRYTRWAIQKLSRGRAARTFSSCTLFAEDAVAVFFHAMKQEAAFRADVPYCLLPDW